MSRYSRIYDRIATTQRQEKVSLTVWEEGDQSNLLEDVEARCDMQALQADVQQRDTQIQQLQTTVAKMGSRESSLMQCILGLDRRIAALKRRPPGPQ
ncbi:hypothetical protein Tco_0897159 [Tanacetum coccineum]